MKIVKLYGGPAHGHEHSYEHLSRRIVVQVPDMIEMDRHRYRSLDDRPITMPDYEQNTYYLKRWGWQGITGAGSRVHKIMYIGVWEHSQDDLIGGLTNREYDDLTRELNWKPWTWDEEPNILTHFHRWWEKATHENGWQEVYVY